MHYPIHYQHENWVTGTVIGINGNAASSSVSLVNIESYVLSHHISSVNEKEPRRLAKHPIGKLILRIIQAQTESQNSKTDKLPFRLLI